MADLSAAGGPAQGLAAALEAVAALHRAGLLAQARTACRALVARFPGEAEPHFRAGLVEAELGSLPAACENLGRAIAISDRSHYRYAMGDVLDRMGDRDGAIESWRRAVAADSALAPAHIRLGMALLETGEIDQAVAHFVMAARLRPQETRTWNNLATALLAQGRPAEAEVAARRAVGIDPGHAIASVNLGRALLAQQRPADAIVVLERAVALDPRQALAWDLLGMGRAQEGAPAAAREAFSRSVQLSPGLSGPWVRLAGACTELGLASEALAAWRRAESLAPADAAQVGSMALFAMQYDGTHGTQEVFDAHRAWAGRYAPRDPREATFTNSRDAGRRLRVGYVSPRFHRSSVAFLHVPVIENHDREAFEIHCYAQQDVEDEVTRRIRASGVSWVDTRSLDDRALAARMREDGIDIAIDLAGHTPGNRLPAFARRPAPVAGTWLDYFNTTGLDAIDFFVTDALHSPPDDRQPFSERLVRLPRCRWCWEPPADAPDVVPPPLARGASAPVLASFARLAKLSAATLDAWCAVLRRVAPARLVLTLPGRNDPACVAPIEAAFRERGVDPARIAWRAATDHGALLAEHREIDIVLDTFPYNGGLTTIEALWMGRPVVTVSGDTLISRQSKAIVATVGLPELCADDDVGFVDVAAGLATDAVRLAALSASLRDRVRASAFLDHAGFTRELEALYRAEWGRWCARRT